MIHSLRAVFVSRPAGYWPEVRGAAHIVAHAHSTSVSIIDGPTGHLFSAAPGQAAVQAGKLGLARGRADSVLGRYPMNLVPARLFIKVSSTSRMILTSRNHSKMV